jgi:ketosteroid isomerase-like protein
MQSWLAKKILAHNLARLRVGDARPSLRLDHPDIRFSFPGESSWAGVVRGKAELARWLARFVEAGLQIYADEVVVKGPPWNTTLCVRGTDHLDAADGTRVYENRYVIWGRMAWGRLREYEVYEDTQRTKALDEYLLAHGIAVPA